MNVMEELFNKAVPVVIKSAERDERQAVIGITVLMNVVTSPVHRKELLVRLTDESDPFFLYSLALGEDDFQGLKVQQGLLVDFSAFPQKFVDLLELCLVESGKENPKFLLHLSLSPADKAVSVLNVVEANPFRHLNHLALKFVPASDAYLKKYLAECLLSFKEENGQLSERLVATRTDLSAQLAQCEEALNSRTRELERLKSDWSAHTTALTNEHTAHLTSEREKAVQLQSEAQRRLERERRELEQSHSGRVESLESRLRELDMGNKELTDHKYRSEAAIREFKTKLRTAEEECVGLREEVQRLRRDNSSLDAGSHEHEKTISQLRTRVAVLEQELQDKEQVISRTSELLEASGEQRRSCETALEQRRRQAAKLEAAFKSASQEVMKGNEIIQKLQTELRNVKSKLKLRNVVTTQQEKLLGEKEVEIGRQKHEIQSLAHTLAQRQEEIKKLEESLESSKQKLEESRELLKTNENVINWLNRQMNEQMMGGRGIPRVPSEPLSSIRPSLPLPPHPTHLTTTTATGLPSHYKPQFSSTPTGVGQRQILGSLASQENIRQQVVFRGPAKKSGIPVPSPLSAHSLSANSVKSTSPVGVKDTGTTPQPHPSPLSHIRGGGNEENEPWLDPKYLPPVSSAHNALPTRNTDPVRSSVSPGVVRLPLKGGPSPGAVSTPGKPPLLSAYFPKS